jgi:hypothetical protein
VGCVRVRHFDAFTIADREMVDASRDARNASLEIWKVRWG